LLGGINPPKPTPGVEGTDPTFACDRKYTAFEACEKLLEFTRVPFGVTNASEELVATFPSLNNSTVGGHA